MNARQVAAATVTPFVSNYYLNLPLGPRAFVVIYGAPGAGKSCMAALLASGLTPAAYVPVEEGISESLTKRLQWLELRNEGLHFFENVSTESLLDLGRDYRVLVIDSVTKARITPDDLGYMPCLVVGTIQVVKDGSAAGSMRWLHDPDVVIRVEGMKWKTEKNRYGALSEGAVV
jgi:predicted ATP-dependent serine protease